MDLELDLEVLNMMEKRNMSYDEAYERITRTRAQLELAGERHRASEVKGANTKRKQKNFQEAVQGLDQQGG